MTRDSDNLVNIARRRFVTAATVGASGLVLAGCDAFDGLLGSDAAVRQTLEKANNLTYRVHRMLLGENSLAQEFTEADIRQPQRPNGVTNPKDEDYLQLAATQFRDYKLEIGGLVNTPRSFSLADLRSIDRKSVV